MILTGQDIMKRDRCFGLKEKKKEKSVPKIWLCPVTFPVHAGGPLWGFWAKGSKHTKKEYNLGTYYLLNSLEMITR